ncbi:enoyl-CoA hydratase [Cupriavidus plantarum]|uniref:Enoyl-CoA hydratase/carnithine racemase n=1 Tax=Cupriavidus plantarum TaxID=942865 RepID=A0A316F0N5_9BURK|nr:enoyl-CoA hydratase [Cupriavidus plantarum]NYH97860.1 enoyl-CoA hydratase/carnithine racemase [Cupriavidus plantarum]PWK38517.1 enoyl-CoA hydratase/carnithine racemase [Cupriavidus plantarum]REE92163.1 enoyl-CoA hydratase/carnithine racemase [Cupriavidus plantarum]RLK35710.1 enoyl-CoA hydratase/carnithine racemase [Cupriavidus plantarum]CAG2127230.1 2,3-dehydroadipyl-CoA hydratase [Cupriavidus plantarum]
MSIATRIDNGILTLTFDRLDRKNAITAAMYQTLADALRSAETDPAVRVIVIEGKPEIFTAGNDLEDFMKRPPTSGEGGAPAPVFQFLYAISEASKPVVASVSGAAVGIGTTLLLHCDLVYASETAKLTLPFTQLGLCPEAASSLLLPRLVGYQRAAEKLLLGEPFSAREAFEIGLVTKVLPLPELDAHVQAQAAKLAALPASSLRETKRLMKGGDAAAVKRQMAEEASVFGRMLVAPEAKEAFTAFFEKRKPDFSKFQ